MHDGEPGYQIEAGAAWDFIAETDALDQLAETCDAVCFGSLAQRSPASRHSIRWFLRGARHALRLYDVNLRRNRLTNEAGYSPEIIEQSCVLATMMKLNCAELFEICDLYEMGATLDHGEEGIRRRIEHIFHRFPVQSVILTRGAEGTTLFTRHGEFHGRVPPIELHDVHPVGAGDACAAGVLCGMVLGWEPGNAVDLANRMGSWVASQLSATPPLPESIKTHMREKTHFLSSV
jgi:fructokinase